MNEVHDIITISLIELIESGFDWGREEWGKGYKWTHEIINEEGEKEIVTEETITDEIRERINKKFEQRYAFREICLVPPIKFKYKLMQFFDEIIEKLEPLYKLVNDGRFDPLETEQKYRLYRSVYNEYPQAQLKIDEVDYATTGTDIEELKKNTGDNLDKWTDFIKNYEPLDKLVLDYLDKAFLQTRSTNLNFYF